MCISLFHSPAFSQEGNQKKKRCACNQIGVPMYELFLNRNYIVHPATGRRLVISITHRNESLFVPREVAWALVWYHTGHLDLVYLLLLRT